MGWLNWLISGESVPAGSNLQGLAWSFRGVSLVWLLLIWLILCGFSYWMYRKESVKKKFFWPLLLFRFGTIALLLLLLARPTLEAIYGGNKPRPVVLLVDNSLSMTFADPRPNMEDQFRVALASNKRPLSQGIPPELSQSALPDAMPNNPSRAEVVRWLLNHPEAELAKKLAERGPVQLKFFGSSTFLASSLAEKAGWDLSKYRSEDTQTKLADAIRSSIETEQPTDLPAALVIFSDGIENGSGTSMDAVLAACKSLSIPIHFVGIGASNLNYVHAGSMQSPDAFFADDSSTITINWQARGLKPGSLNLALSLAGVPLASKEVQAENGDQLSTQISFTPPKGLRADGPVELDITLSGPALAGSTSPSVSWRKMVQLVERKVRVLVLDRTPRWEVKHLMATLLRDRRVEATFHFTENDPKGMQQIPFIPELPVTRQELFAYDMIILGDVPAEALGTERITWIRDFVQDGGGLVHIAGKLHAPVEYKRTPLAEVLPIEAAEEMPPFDDKLAQEAYLPKLTLPGQRHEMLSLVDTKEENEELFSKFAPWFGVFPTVKVRPGAVTLLSHPQKKLEDTLLPVIATQRFGRGQSLFIASDETWRWRANQGEKYHTRFWGQVVYQYGLAHVLGGSRRVQLNLERAENQVGKPGFVYARAYDTQYKPYLVEQLEAKLIPISDDGKSLIVAEPKRITLEAIPNQPGEYRALMVHDKPGRFQLSVDVPDPALIHFSVSYPPEDERIPSPMRDGAMQGWAKSTGGEFFREETFNKLSETVKTQLGQFSVRRDILFWNPLALLLVSILLATEWTLRKFANLS